MRHDSPVRNDKSERTPDGERTSRVPPGRPSSGVSSRRDFLRTTAVCGSVALLGAGPVTAQDGGDQRREFTVRIENVSSSDTLQVPDAESQPVPLSPGVYAVYVGSNPLFTPGQQTGDSGLEQLAEDGDPARLEETVDGRQNVESDVFSVPEGSDRVAPLEPDQSYAFDFDARPGQRMSFATMFIPSNDLFLAPDGLGVNLFPGGDPVSGDLTPQVLLWDAGTEQNEQPGTGPNQAQRQSAPDTGPDENAPVRPITRVDDGFQYPAVSDVVRVTVRSGR